MMDDSISRQAAIDAFTGVVILEPAQSAKKYIDGVIERIQNLPSAQPEVLACGEGELSAQPEQQNPYSVCDLCIYNPPSSMDGKPCSMCVAQDKPKDPDSWSYS